MENGNAYIESIRKECVQEIRIILIKDVSLECTIKAIDNAIKRYETGISEIAEDLIKEAKVILNEDSFNMILKK